MLISVAGQHHCFRVPRVIFGAAFTQWTAAHAYCPWLCSKHSVYTLFNDGLPRQEVYVGYTTCVLRRLRQHNGEISGGARQTRRIRLRTGCEWRVSQVTTGFPDKKSALQFEWALQHPSRTTALTTLQRSMFKGRKGGKQLSKKRFAAMVLRSSPPFCFMSLEVLEGNGSVWNATVV